MLSKGSTSGQDLKLLRIGLVLARGFRGKALGVPPSERVRLRRKMREAVGKAFAVSLSFFFDVSDLEMEADLPCVATLF